MKKNQIIEKTKNDYNLISQQFSSTRKNIWKEFGFLFENLEKNTSILDLGCGNGRFYHFFKDKKINYWGVDISEKLIEKAKENHPRANFETANALNLPFEDEKFDSIFSLAVFHHIPTVEERIKFLKEAKRVLKKNGILKISVWNLLEYKKELYFKNIFKKISGEISFRDVFLPWKNSKGEIITERYYHFFTQKELEEMVGKFFEIKEIFKKGEGVGSNIFVICKNVDKKDN